jgi:hypothetical protein
MPSTSVPRASTGPTDGIGAEAETPAAASRSASSRAVPLGTSGLPAEA